MGIQNEVLKISQSYGIKANIINPYTIITMEELLNKWEKVATALTLAKLFFEEESHYSSNGCLAILKH